jgi:hypothetical protein
MSLITHRQQTRSQIISSLKSTRQKQACYQVLLALNSIITGERLLACRQALQALTPPRVSQAEPTILVPERDRSTQLQQLACYERENARARRALRL